MSAANRALAWENLLPQRRRGDGGVPDHAGDAGYQFLRRFFSVPEAAGRRNGDRVGHRAGEPSARLWQRGGFVEGACAAHGTGEHARLVWNRSEFRRFRVRPRRPDSGLVPGGRLVLRYLLIRFVGSAFWGGPPHHPASVSATLATMQRKTRLVGVLFDWDGTLIDSYHADSQAYLAMFRELGLTWGMAELDAHYSPDWYA